MSFSLLPPTTVLLLSVTDVAGAILMSPLEHAASDTPATAIVIKSLQFTWFLRRFIRSGECSGELLREYYRCIKSLFRRRHGTAGNLPGSARIGCDLLGICVRGRLQHTY